MKNGYLLPTGGSAPSVIAAPIRVALSRALLAGFLASLAMLVAFSVAFVVALILGNTPVPIVNDWSRGLTSNALIDVARPSLYGAAAIFFAGGLLWALLYGLVFEPRLKGPGWQRGMLFALIPWLFSLAVFLPIVGGGLLGFGLGAGPLPLVGNLILHAVYGAVLGTVYGPVGDSVLDGPRHAAAGDDIWAGPSSEIGAARGLMVGLGLGILAGFVGVALMSSTFVLHLNPLAVVLPLALVGAAFGGFIGSLAGPSRD